MKITHVSFDIADGDFTFYTGLEWHNFIAGLREELVEEDDYWADGTVDQVLEVCLGDEFFWAEVK